MRPDGSCPVQARQRHISPHWRQRLESVLPIIPAWPIGRPEVEAAWAVFHAGGVTAISRWLSVSDTSGSRSNGENPSLEFHLEFDEFQCLGVSMIHQKGFGVELGQILQFKFRLACD